MVALNPDYAPSETVTRPENRVGDFFWLGADRVGKNRLPSRMAAKEKSSCRYETASGRPFWLSREPLGELGPDGPNLYWYGKNSPINYTDPTGLWNLFNPLTWGLPTQPGENPWNPVDSSAEWGATGEGASEGAAAYADGLIPFVDPFDDHYDKCDKSTQWSKVIGSGVRDGLLFYSGGASMAVVRTERISTSLAQRTMVRELGPSWTTAIGGKMTPGSLFIDYTGKWVGRVDTGNNLFEALSDDDCN